MKNKWMLFLLVAATSMAGCKKDRPELEAPGSKLEGINSNWEMVEVIQVDIASLQQKRLDVSEAFIGSAPMKIKINSSDFTYTVTKGSGPNYFGDSGSWAFDDNEFPTKVTLSPSAGEQKVLKLVRTIRPTDAFLNVMYSRTCPSDEDPYVAYEFKFIRTN